MLANKRVSGSAYSVVVTAPPRFSGVATYTAVITAAATHHRRCNTHQRHHRAAAKRRDPV